MVPFGSIFVGEQWQFPLIWESVLFGLALAPTAPLMWVNDQNQTWGETFALRFKLFRGRPNLGAFAMSVLLFSAVYIVVYFLSFGAIRISGAATSVGTPWRFPETAVYDPQGYFEKRATQGRTTSARGQVGSIGRPTVVIAGDNRENTQSELLCPAIANFP
ncbi:spirocyclase AveC family protein [Nocardia gamkensis]|uniref:spirocyclase AveC family protein n=1 Tax=Nocardia gamkensis TaxID=352869 RepID=UPI0036E53EB7